MGSLEYARIVGVAHALRVEIYAYLAPGNGGKQRDVLHVVSELTEAGGVRLPFVNLSCVFQGLHLIQLLGRGVCAVAGFSFFAWQSALWGRWLCDT